MKDECTLSIPIESFSQTENMVINVLSSEDIKIIENVKSLAKYNLGQSNWALGVVTGDNKTN